MKFYHLPDNKQFNLDFKEDLKNAEEVIIISPFLSANVIADWRKIKGGNEKENFTIVYDIGNENEGRRSGLEGKIDDEILSKITWKHCERLHTKIYYFKFSEGFAFYHGSANFTNFGLGGSISNISKNKELLTRVSDQNLEKEINDLIDYYINSDEVVPTYNNESKQWRVPQVQDGKIMEYKNILIRMELADRYFPVVSDIVLKGERDPLRYVKGVFGTNNHRYLKMHTTNDIDNPRFTFTRQELKWFLGNFYKDQCLKSNRKLVLVIKENGSWQGNLTVISLEPIQLFNLLASSNRTKKVKVDNSTVTINIKKNEEGKLLITRYRRSIQVKPELIERILK